MLLDPAEYSNCMHAGEKRPFEIPCNCNLLAALILNYKFGLICMHAIARNLD